MARRVLDLSIYVPARADRGVTENITSSDAGELVRDANGNLFALKIPGQADKKTVEYSGRGAWAAPALKGIERGDEITVVLMGLNKHEMTGVTMYGLVDGFTTSFNQDKQLVDWSIRIIEV
jgi:hypothetical protein